MQFFKFPSIEAFHNKVKEGQRTFVGEQTFIKKTKLHGTNAAIVIHPEHGVYAQSRNRVITPEDDNYGFAEFVSKCIVKSGTFWALQQSGCFLIIYGEWSGEGINKTDAITKLNKKVFCPFLIGLKNIKSGEFEDIYIKSEDIKGLIALLGIEDEHKYIKVIDDLETITINFNEETGLNEVVDTLNGWVDDISKCDQWVKDKFGVEGSGEGFVLAPDTNDYEVYKKWIFKIKTENHNVNKTAKPVTLSAEVSKDVDDFISRFLTEARIQQAVSELGGVNSLNMKRLGEFLKWIGQDVKKESVDEIEASEFEWSDVSKRLNNKARLAFMKIIDEKKSGQLRAGVKAILDDQGQ